MKSSRMVDSAVFATFLIVLAATHKPYPPNSKAPSRHMLEPAG
jgi:hypothetical protein